MFIEVSQKYRSSDDRTFDASKEVLVAARRMLASMMDFVRTCPYIDAHNDFTIRDQDVLSPILNTVRTFVWFAEPGRKFSIAVGPVRFLDEGVSIFTQKRSLTVAGLDADAADRHKRIKI